MKHVDLFAGIGSFSLAASWMGWETIAYCEKNKFCQKVLKYYHPNATAHEDIKTTDFTIYRGQCDILTGGFPCQPFSLNGKRTVTVSFKGKSGGQLRVYYYSDGRIEEDDLHPSLYLTEPKIIV